MIGLTFILIALCISVNAEEDCTSIALRKIKRFSTDQAVQTLSLLYDVQLDSIDHPNLEERDKLANLISCKYGSFNVTQVEKSIYDVIHENSLHISFYSRMMGLVTFNNLLRMMMACVGVMCVVSVAYDLLVRGFGLIFRIIFNKQSLYLIGLSLSTVYIYYKEHEDKGPLEFLFIFGNQSCFFGVLLFNVIALFMMDDAIPKNRLQQQIDDVVNFSQTIIVGVYIWTAIYHGSHSIGTLTVIQLFCWWGFSMGSIFGGYRFGFNNEFSLQKCTIIAFFLNLFYGHRRIFGYTDFAYLAVFETGVIFWGTLVGLIALLIIQSSHYRFYDNRNDYGKHLLHQLIMIVLCIFLMYLGTVYDIEPYRNLGGTFLLFVCLDIEAEFLFQFKNSSFTGFLFVLFMTLYGISYVINKHPEYFIFM